MKRAKSMTPSTSSFKSRVFGWRPRRGWSCCPWLQVSSGLRSDPVWAGPGTICPCMLQAWGGWGGLGERAAVSPSFLGRGYQTLPRPEGAPAHSMATLRILASMPSRTIGEWDPLPLFRL